MLYIFKLSFLLFNSVLSFLLNPVLKNIRNKNGANIDIFCKLKNIKDLLPLPSNGKKLFNCKLSKLITKVNTI
ncbi:hypothetical protein D3C73_1546670 [compost metagenome]